jgi:Zn-dependent peptidase ImmA (M78 family)
MKSKKRNIHHDPDVLALIVAGGGLADPRSLVINQAHKLNALYRQFDGATSEPFERLIQLSSLRGFAVGPMELNGRHDTDRDAVVLMTDSTNNKRGQIFYNPLRPKGRIAFSIAHEIAHTFFPSTHGGARFREMLDDDSQETSELELLCHAGAAELLMPLEEFSIAASPEWTLKDAPRLATRFGASIEATVFRLATAHPGIAIAGLASFRHTKGDEEKLRTASHDKQTELFASMNSTSEIPIQKPKYRRQSLHISENCPNGMLIPWNKSFLPSSCLYQASFETVISSPESHPMHLESNGVMEAVCAPYQRPDNSIDHPDVLFLWKPA